MNFKVEIPVTCEKSSGAQKSQDCYLQGASLLQPEVEE